MGTLYHTAFGVYGILTKGRELLVIRKNGGPYINRYDLPGGSLEEGEALTEALKREFYEETGLTISTQNQLGTTNFLYPWKFEETTMNNHICVFYEIRAVQGRIKDKAPQFEGQDSLGALWLPVDKINGDNSSLLVLKAKEFMTRGAFIQEDWRLDSWRVLDS